MGIKIETVDGVKVMTIDPGNTVLCDTCNRNMTNDTKSGGFLFMSHAVCPYCCGDFEETAKKYNETRFIRARCPENMSFANWVREELRPHI